MVVRGNPNLKERFTKLLLRNVCQKGVQDNRLNNKNDA